MLVSHQQKFVFIHIHKTAGLSITDALSAVAGDATYLAKRHTRAAEGKRLLKDRWDDYVRIAFVRNPWCRLVSWYEMIASRTSRYDPLFWRKPVIWRYAVRNSRNFEEFVLNCTDEVNDRGVVKSFCHDQLSYIADPDGTELVNFIGRFEHLEDDYARLATRLDVKNNGLPLRNGAGRKRDYRNHYSDRTAEIVAQRFARDIDRFGYRF